MLSDPLNAERQALIAHPVIEVGGEMEVPGDKSISHRSALLSAVASGTSTIGGFLRGEDCLATLAALQAMGVEISLNGDELRVEGVGLGGLRTPPKPLNLGNSGTGMRLLAGLLAAQPFESVLTGDESLRRRPMGRVAEPLRAMGAVVETHAGTAPLRINGTLPPDGDRLHVAGGQRTAQVGAAASRDFARGARPLSGPRAEAGITPSGCWRPWELPWSRAPMRLCH